MLEHLSFLIDENLTPDLAALAQGRGFYALHATWAGLSGKKDHQVAAYAAKKSMVLVTNDLSDFRKIYKRKKLHSGVVFLAVMDSDIMDREAQKLMFAEALDVVAINEPINEAIQVQLGEAPDGENFAVTVTRYSLAKPGL